jgi:hypothetical protein
MLFGDIPEVTVLQTLLIQLRARLVALHGGEDGYSTETVIVTALLVVAAITAVGYITTKIISKAKGLSVK